MSRPFGNGAWIALLTLVALLCAAPLALAANDPGHDSLYVLRIGDTNVTGSINLTGNVTASFVRFTSKAFGDYLDIVANGTVLGAPSTPRILGATGSLYIDSTGGLYLNTKGGTSSTIQIGDTATNGVTLNVSGVIRQQNVLVCLANGTNCVSGNNSGNVSTVGAGAGLANSGTATDPVLDVGAGSGITVAADSVAVDATVCRSDGSNCPASSGEGGWTNTSTETTTLLNATIKGVLHVGPVVQPGYENYTFFDAGSGRTYFATNVSGGISSVAYWNMNTASNVGVGILLDTGYPRSDIAGLYATPVDANNGYFLIRVKGGGTLSTTDPSSAPFYIKGTGSNTGETYINGGPVIINDNSLAAADLRVEGDTDVNLVFTDASADNVGIGTSNPTQKLDVNGSVNVSGTSAELWVNGYEVCLSDGTNCPASTTPYQSSAAGWTNTTTTISALLNVNITGANTTAATLTINAVPGQTSNLQEWKNSTGTPILSIGSEGTFHWIAPDGGNTYLNSTSGNVLYTPGVLTASLGMITNGYYQVGSYGTVLSQDYLQLYSGGKLKANGVATQWTLDRGIKITTNNGSIEPLVLKANNTQAENLTEWQDSTGAVLAAVNGSGSFFIDGSQVCTAGNGLCAGASAQPSGWLNSSTTVYLANNATNVSIGNTTGNVPVLFVDNTNGRVGILMSTPAAAFDIRNKIGLTETIRARQTDQNYFGISVLNEAYGTGDYDGLRFYVMNSGNTYIYNPAGKNFSINTGPSTYGSSRLTVTSDGNVGIGTTTPTASLTVAGNIHLGGVSVARGILQNTSDAADAGWTFLSGGGGTANSESRGGSITAYGNEQATYPGAVILQAGAIAGGAQTGAIVLDTGNARRMIVSSDGNVGIGTITPNQKLEVNGSVNVSSGNLSLTSTYSMCFNSGCTARIYHNGSALIIEGT